MNNSWEKWWKQPRNWEKIFKGSLWLLLPLAILTCHQIVRHQRSKSFIASDSTTIVNGKTSKGFVIDTVHYPISTREVSDFIRNATERNAIGKKIKSFYIANGLRTKWLGKNSPTKEYYGLVKLLREAGKHALSYDRYALTDIEKEMRDIYENDGDADAIPELDMRISERYFLFARHLRDGRIKPQGHGKAIWKSTAKEENDDDVKALLHASGSNLADLTQALQPQHEQYPKLVNAYNTLLELHKKHDGKFDHIAIDKKIKPHDKHRAIPAIRRRIEVLESRTFDIPYDTATGTPDSLLYDDALIAGLKSFQEHHGLEPTGVIGGKTIMFLNKSFMERAMLVALAIERQRWKPQTFGERYIVVNIPNYRLHAYHNGKEQLSMKVIVGAPEKPTPVFDDMLEYLIFSPTWNVPASIIEEEILPRIQEDPDYYSERNYTFYRNRSEVDPLDENWDEDIDPKELTIVQQPGADNALGLVKFVMPNHLNIYMHDTPQQYLFKKYWRAFSHGCIRLDEPEKFAEYLLDDNTKWNRQAIVEAMHSGEPKTVKLKNFHRVFIDYQTVWVDENEDLNFREDVYGHDRVHLRQLRPYLPERSMLQVAAIAY